MSEAYDDIASREPFESGDAAWARTLDAAYVALVTEGEAEQRDLSADMRARLEREGADAVGERGAGIGLVERPAAVARLGWLSWAGWAAAAAIAMAFMVFGLPSGKQGTGQLVAAVDQAADVVSWPFAGLTDEFKGAKGKVVWSSTLQKGYLWLTGVPANAPAASQYQLWIVDPARDQHPIDGGVFDVASGEVVVPIDAKLTVGTPAAFAITREKPGGVVVSAGPLLMAAKP